MSQSLKSRICLVLNTSSKTEAPLRLHPGSSQYHGIPVLRGNSSCVGRYQYVREGCDRRVIQYREPIPSRYDFSLKQDKRLVFV